MDKKEKDLLIVGIIIAGGLGLYYLFEDKGKFSIGYVPNYAGTNVSEFVSGFGNNSPANSVNTSCPSGYTYANGVCNLNTVSCPSGYTLSNGECLQNQPTTATATPAYNTNISYYDTGSTVLKGLNTGINSIVNSLDSMSGFYNSPSSVLQACQDVAQRVNDYFPNNTLVPQFVTAYTTAYQNGTIGSVFKQALSGAYNNIQFINNFIQLVNSGYGVSSATTATPTATTATPANVTFSGSAGNLNGTLFTISGSGNTLSSSTDAGYVSGTSNWVSSGAITYSNGSFSGSLGNVNGSLTIISASGNTLIGHTDTGWVLQDGSGWQNTGSITYNPSNNTFSGSIGDVQGSTFVLYGQGNKLVSQVNTNTLGSSGSGWQPAGSITATQS